jgi:hypothetical protein
MSTPYVISSDLVSAYPAKSLEIAQYIDGFKADLALVQNAQTGTTYTLAAADFTKLVTLSNASPVAVTLPLEATVPWPAGTQLRLLNLGAGLVTVAGAVGVTINGSPLTLAQYKHGTLVKTGTNIWTFVPTGAGKVLQVVSTTKTDTFTVSAASAAVTDVTGLSASITPSSTTSRIMAMWSVSGYAANVGFATVLKRDGTGVGVGAAAGSRTRVTDLGAISNGGTDGNMVATGHYLDSPASVSALTYQIAIVNQRASTQVLNVNLVGNDSDLAYIVRSASMLTLMEVSA